MLLAVCPGMGVGGRNAHISKDLHMSPEEGASHRNSAFAPCGKAERGPYGFHYESPGITL